jgi:cell division protein DivIC
VKKYFIHIKNKYIIAIILFLVYALFLDDTDIFTIVNHNIKLNKLEQAKEEMAVKLESTAILVKKLKYEDALESYAREKKLFKLDNEDIFVISYE